MQYVFFFAFFLIIYILIINNSDSDIEPTKREKNRRGKGFKGEDLYKTTKALQETIESMEKLHQEQQISQISERFSGNANIAKPPVVKLTRNF